MPHSWFKFVRHEEVPAWSALGWALADLLDGTPHGEFSVLMKWPGIEEPVIPGRERDEVQGF